jgi:hypothetical protein
VIVQGEKGGGGQAGLVVPVVGSPPVVAMVVVVVDELVGRYPVVIDVTGGFRCAAEIVGSVVVAELSVAAVAVVVDVASGSSPGWAPSVRTAT